MLAGSGWQAFFALLDYLSGKLLVRGSVVCSMETRGTFDGIGDARTDVFRADVALEFGLMHELGGLFASSAQ